MAKMSDKTKRAINRGRRKAGLKPIKFGAKKKKSNETFKIPKTWFRDPLYTRKMANELKRMNQIRMKSGIKPLKSKWGSHNPKEFA